MVEVSTITATLSAAITAPKEIGRVAEKTKDKELNKLVLDLQQSIMKANTQLLELSSENQSLLQRVTELERQDNSGVCNRKAHTSDFRFPQPNFFAGPKRGAEF